VTGPVKTLLDRGVVLDAPEQVWVGPEVDPERIAPGVRMGPGCRVEGATTSIGPGCVIGAEGPATVRGCQLTRDVQLGSGFFDGSVFLDGASMGGGAHVRPGCLIEEQASGAHSVGLKQTILFPYVTLGSLINFCDVLMAGGTSRKNHSEVGSSYIHFNFTPHQDKATASLLGDVPRGVVLDQPPIFLGGQGGLVGPCRLAFGTVVAAGQVLRRDVEIPGRLVLDPVPPTGERDYDPSRIGRIGRIVTNNLIYLGNLLALSAWYEQVRRRWMEQDAFALAAHAGALAILDDAVKERSKRLDELTAKLDPARASGPVGGEQAAWKNAWPGLRDQVHATAAVRGGAPPESFAAALSTRALPTPYLNDIPVWPGELKAAATVWLDAIAGAPVAAWNTKKAG
jgi:UDP-N-acetylglucosamine/UDP-N-acetylgalactosamine diphosphorylase